MFSKKLTCPHCNKDVATVGFRYGRIQSLSILALIALSLYYSLSITLFKPIASEDLKLTINNTGLVGKELVVTGVITNHSGSTWESVSVEAEFFDETGKYIGEGQDYIGSDVQPNTKENFEVRFRQLPEAVLAGKAKTELKIAGGICF